MRQALRNGGRGVRCGLFALALVATGLSACSVHDARLVNTVDLQKRWVLLPVMNHAEAPRAGERVEAILSTLLRSRGVEHLSYYPQPRTGESLPELNERKRFEDALAWAQQQGFDYGVTGAVTEWRYKAGLDGEPACGVQVDIRDLRTGHVLCSAAGSRAGWGRESVSGACQRLLNSLLDDLDLD